MTPTGNIVPLRCELHTNRELEFMLTRGKPLVLDGKFVKPEFVEPQSGPPPPGHLRVRGIRHVFYAKSAEAWRIDAYIMMLAVAAKAGWNEGFERLEGSLLGYEEWQTDLHLERLRVGPHAKKFYWLRKP